MKKIAVFLLVSLLISAFGGMGVSASANTGLEKDIEIMNVLGIMTGDEEGNFNPKDCLTRAEFAKIICVLDGFSDNLNYAAGAGFRDVSFDHWAYDYICYVASNDYMIGDDMGNFRPEDCITGNEASKVLIHLLGYAYQAERNGTYPTGYVLTADSLDMYKNLKLDYSEYLLREEIARLLNNALNVSLVQLVTVSEKLEYQVSKDKTLLSEIFRMKRGKGLVLSTDSAAILSSDIAPDGKININGIEMKTAESFEKMLGSKVEYIYRFEKNEDGANELVYLYPLDDRSISIAKRDYEGFSGNRLTYQVSEEKSQEVSVSQTASYVVNGTNVVYYDGIFDVGKAGTITLVSTENNSTYDVVLIENATILTVGTIDQKNLKIYDKFTTNECIDLSDIDITYTIQNSEGEPLDFAAIKEDDILTCMIGSDKVNIIVSDQSVSGVVESISENGLFLAGANYLPDYYGKAQVDKVQSGDTVVAYLDAYGEIASISVVSAVSGNMAYLVALDEEKELDEVNIRIRLFTSKGVFEKYELASRVFINDELQKNLTLNGLKQIIATDANDLESYNGIVSYELDEDGKVKKLYTGRTEQNLEQSGRDGLCLKYAQNTRRYYKSNLGFDYQIYYNSNTVFFKVPQDSAVARDRDYEVITSSYFADGSAYSVLAYVNSLDDVASSAIVVKVQSAASEFKDKEEIGAVSKISVAVDEWGELIKKIHIYKGKYSDSKNEKELYLYLDENLKDDINDYDASDIKQGDLIKFMFDKDGRVRKFQLYYNETKGFYTNSDEQEPNETERVLKGKIKALKQNYMEFSNSQYNELYLLDNMVIVLVNKANGIVKLGDRSDVVPGAECIVQIISRMPRVLFILK